MRKLLCGVAAATSIFAFTPTADAHHSLSAYDITKSITVDGTITRYEWTAPHCWLIVKEDNGREWAFEAGTPIVNNKFGWTRTAFKVGEKVKVFAAPVRDGTAHGALMSVQFSDGRKLDGPLATYLKQ